MSGKKIVVDFGLCEANAVCMGILPEVFDLDDIPLRAPTNQCSGGAQVIAPGMQVGGPGGDLMEALEQGLFDRIGANTEPSSLAGVWADGGEVS